MRPHRRIYRPVMRAMHRLGWCYPEPVLVEDGFVWCHWCGMRGRRVTTDMAKVAADIAAHNVTRSGGDA